MIATIKINSDDDFHFNLYPNDQIVFPHKHECANLEEGLEYIRDFLWSISRDLHVNYSAERQKDHIKLHTGERRKHIEKCLEKLYAATYYSTRKEETDCGFQITSGNWSFQWSIK